jgi:thiamine-monophosphate kinase
VFRWSGWSEESLIRRIRRIFAEPPPAIDVPIGDDAALARLSRTDRLILTTDQMVEGIHFRRMTHPANLLGARALAINLSDLAAMGGTPRWFLLSLFLPPDLPPSYLLGALAGMAREAGRRRVYLIGGNLTAAPVFSLDIALAGTMPRGDRPLLRSGARPGDSLYVSGSLGGSALGFELLGQGWRWRRGKAARKGAPPGRVLSATHALRRHLAPEPEARLGLGLRRRRLASAAIDLSDGLSLDLSRLCRASGVGARLDEQSLPLDPAAVALRGQRRATFLALHGGEDYRLLFAVPPAREPRLRKWLRAAPFHRIGTITPDRGRILVVSPTGRARVLRSRGYDHLLSRRG